MLESRQIKCRYIIRYKARNVWYKNNPCFVSAVSFIDTLQHGCLYQKLADQYFEWTTTVINYWINRNPFLDDIGLSIIGELKSDLEQDPTMITLDSIALFAFLSGIIIDIRDIKFDLE